MELEQALRILKTLEHDLGFRGKRSRDCEVWEIEKKEAELSEKIILQSSSFVMVHLGRF